jgi:hypothetical protein
MENSTRMMVKPIKMMKEIFIRFRVKIPGRQVEHT